MDPHGVDHLLPRLQPAPKAASTMLFDITNCIQISPMKAVQTALRGISKLPALSRWFGLCAILVQLAGVQAAAQTIASSTIAGQAGVAASTDSPARFNYPQRVAVDAAGNVYVADSGNHTIRKISTTGVTTTLAGVAGVPGQVDGTGVGATFRSPQGIVADTSGNLYIADTLNHSIRKLVIATGQVTVLAGTLGSSGAGYADNPGTAAKFNAPDGLAIDVTAGILYVADTGNCRIRKVIISTAVVSTVAGDGTNGHADGVGIAAKFDRPGSVALDATGTNLYVADSYNHVIRQIVLGTQTVSTLAGAAGVSGALDGAGGSARFYLPGGVAVDSAGNIVVADSLNHCIRKVTTGGAVTTYVGQPGSSGSLDGFGAAVRFMMPQGVATTPTGFIFVADTSNHSIRKVGTASAPTATAPASVSVSLGAAASFSVTAFGFPIPTYQWQRQVSGSVGFVNLANDSVYSGVTTATLNISATSAAMSGDQFQCVVSNGYAPVGTSAAATLTVQVAPAITSAATTTFAVATPGSFTVTATGSPAPTTWTLSGNPGWLTLTPVVGAPGTATLSGTPGSTTGSPHALTITASNGVGAPATQSFSLVVLPTQGLPTITAQPSAASVNPTQTATFTVAAAGNPAPTYRWQRATASSPAAFSDIYDGGSYSGAATATLAVTGTTTTMSGDIFRCVVSNAYGPVFSSTATLTVLYPPTITSAATTTFVVGSLNTFMVAATGGPAPTYSLSGHPAGMVSINATTGAMTGSPGSTVGSPFTFTVTATNSQGSVNQTFVLNVLPTAGAPTITTQPTNQTVAFIGQNVVFTMAAAGNPSPNYLWQIKPAGASYYSTLTEGGNYTGVTSASLTVSGTTNAMNGDEFQCLVSNAYGTVITSAAKLIIPIAPAITSAASATFVVGSPNSFTVTGTGGPAPTYTLSGSVPTGWFSFNSVTGVMSGVPSNTVGSPFIFTITGTNGVNPAATQAFTLTVIPAPTTPVITTQPLANSLGIGDTATFTVVATGSPDPTYQWQRIPAGTAFLTNIVDDASNFSGATTSTLTVKNVSTGMSGDQYICVVTNSAGSVSSSPATLTVNTASVFATWAGSPGVSGHADASGLANRFYSPSALAVDIAGNLYVADTLNNVIRKIAPDGVATTIAGSPGVRGSDDGVGSLARFNAPAGVAVDQVGNVYVSDTSNHTIRRISPNGTVITLAGLAGASGSADGIGSMARFSFPYGMVVDSVGNLYVADSFNNTIRHVSSVGIVSTVAGTAGVRGTVDGTGAAARFAFPYGLAIDSLNTVYIADSLNHTIRKMAAGGVVTTIAGVAGSSGAVDGAAAAAKFSQPSGLAVDASGTIYVADTYNNTLRKIAGGTVSTVAGLAGVPGKADGTGNGARFDHPFSIALNAAGTVFVADTYNHTIRKSGAVTAPQITTQPTSQAVGEGRVLTFAVAATGVPAPTYQWQRKTAGSDTFVDLTEGTPFTGVATSILTVSPTTNSMNGDQFQCVVKNGVSPDATSSIAILSIGSVPAITAQPSNVTATVGTVATLSVQVTGLPEPTYQWKKAGVDVSGATAGTLTINNVQLSDAGTYSVVVTNSLGSVTSNAAVLTVQPPSPPVISQPVKDQVGEVGGTVLLAAPAMGSPSPTYQWRKNGAVIPGATGAILELKNVQPGDAGQYDVLVSNSAGSITSNIAVVTIVNRSFAGTYFGTFGANNGNFAILVRHDNSAVLLGYVASFGLAIRNANVRVDDQGVFTISQTSTASDGEPRAAADQVTVTGVISTTGSISGSVSGVAGTSMSGARSNPTGSTQNYAGYYQAGAANSSAGTVMIVGTAGQAFVMTQSSTLTDAGVGTVDNSGRITLTTTKQTTVSATVAADASKVSATVVDSKGAVTSYTGGSESTVKAQRLANISTRAQVSSGDSVAIAGFVIQGTEAKQVLIRAVGPTLANFGVANALANPKLELRSASGSVLAANTGWSTASNAAAITTTSAQLNAFALTSNADSAILTTLGPGSYTAIVSSATTLQGVALIEVYDTSSSVNQKLVNISTRAVAGAGENSLIAGVVVTGTMPKRVLIRAVGPSLSQFGLTNLLANPQLTVFKGSQVVAQNAGWTVSPDASAIADAASQAQAFPLVAGRADAALLLNLEPGIYSAQVTGLNNTSGNCIVEVYEVP